jgi:uncharacterized protein (TIGR02145 family)
MSGRYGPLKTPTTVVIGTQEWMIRNLDVTRYRNGDIIPEEQNQSAWAQSTTGIWCYYDNDPANGAIYGKLYNGAAVNDPRGLAPLGYHIPTQTEYLILQEYLGGVFAAGGALKETGTSYWTNPNEGATNSSGWTGLPGGNRDGGVFNFINDQGTWWTSTEFGYNFGVYLQYNSTFFGSDDGSSLRNGYSVRCLKD